MEKLYFCTVVLKGSIFQVKSTMSAVLSINERIAQFIWAFFLGQTQREEKFCLFHSISFG